jgi:FixJ family two-component response regulator
LDGSWRGCLLLDLRLGGMNGLELQRALRSLGCRIPVILISAHADIRSVVLAMNQGAITVLEKPYETDELTGAIRRAMDIDERQRQDEAAQEALKRQLSQLTARERRVMDLLAEGKPRKAIVCRLGVSLRTVERLCARVYEKTATDNPADLARLLIQVRDMEAVPDDKRIR